MQQMDFNTNDPATTRFMVGMIAMVLMMLVFLTVLTGIIMDVDIFSGLPSQGIWSYLSK
jgi:cytochrome b subunit of formate dehydrogenase